MKDRLNQRQHMDAIENDLKTALGDEPEEPMMPLLVVDDPTLEGLQHHLNKNLPYVGLMTDEGAQFLGGFSMKDENRSRTAAGLSSLWGNGQLTILRASKDTIHLDDKRLTVHLMVQPLVAKAFLEDGFMVDQGIINRFLIAHPESLIGQRPYKSGDVTTTEAYKVYEARIETLLRGLYRVGEDVPEIRTLVLSEAAVSAWIEFYNEVEKASGPGGRYHDIGGYASKAGENCKRIAGVLELVENPNSDSVGHENLERAITLMRWYLDEALRIIGDGLTSQARRLLEWIYEARDKPLSEPLTATELAKYAPGRELRDRENYVPALQCLEEAGVVQMLPVPKGAQTRRWEIVVTADSNAHTHDTHGDAA